MTVAGDSKFKTLADLVAYGKKNPKMLKFAGTSPGGWSEIQTGAFFKRAGVDVTFVPFDSGAEIKAAILGGHIHGAVEELAETLPLIEAGKLRSLAVIMEKRHPALPNVPCTAELGIDYTHGLMRAWGVKKGTPPDRHKISPRGGQEVPGCPPSTRNSSRTTILMPVRATWAPRKRENTGTKRSSCTPRY